jgi:DNA-binding Xre family transcriptional regulator
MPKTVLVDADLIKIFRHKMIDLGLNTVSLSKIIDIHQSRLSEILSGKIPYIRPKTYRTICTGLLLDIDESRYNNE